jgi:predicted RNase H-like nuclease (RuvC/YqgF family)
VDQQTKISALQNENEILREQLHSSKSSVEELTLKISQMSTDSSQPETEATTEN